MEDEFKNRLMKLENGRFAKIINALSVSDSCEKCYYFNPKEDDPMKGFLCNCLGSCPAATLHPRMQEYIWRKLG